jgi:hypothetical protein
VAQTFLEGIPEYSRIIFWTNHQNEYKVFKKVCKERKVEADILFNPFRTREKAIVKDLKKVLGKGMEFKSSVKLPDKDERICDELCTEMDGRTFIDLAHINDLIHTSIILDELMSKKRMKEFYVFFNFRSDRPERVFVYLDAFLPLFEHAVKGIIVRSDSLPLSPEFSINRIKKTYFKGSKVPFYSCETLDDFTQKVLPNIPKKSNIVMVGNTADKFGKDLIAKFGMFRKTYPILNEVEEDLCDEEDEGF